MNIYDLIFKDKCVVMSLFAKVTGEHEKRCQKLCNIVQNNCSNITYDIYSSVSVKSHPYFLPKIVLFNLHHQVSN